MWGLPLSSWIRAPPLLEGQQTPPLEPGEGEEPREEQQAVLVLLAREGVQEAGEGQAPGASAAGGGAGASAAGEGAGASAAGGQAWLAWAAWAVLVAIQLAPVWCLRSKVQQPARTRQSKFPRELLCGTQEAAVLVRAD